MSVTNHSVKNNFKKSMGSFMCEGTFGPTCLPPDTNGILVGISSDSVLIVHSEGSISSAQSFSISDSLLFGFFAFLHL
jgi:hypothetical protein